MYNPLGRNETQHGQIHNACSEIHMHKHMHGWQAGSGSECIRRGNRMVEDDRGNRKCRHARYIATQVRNGSRIQNTVTRKTFQERSGKSACVSSNLQTQPQVLVLEKASSRTTLESYHIPGSHQELSRTDKDHTVHQR